MRAGQVMVVWTLLVVTGASLALAAGATWYEFSSDMPGGPTGPFASSQADIEPPKLLIHTSLHTPWHSMESGGSGSLRDYEQVPFVAAVTATVVPLFYLGTILVLVGIISAVLRMNGRRDRSGAAGYAALAGVLILGLAVFWFSGMIATGFEKELSHTGDGEFERDAPELAFFTANAESPDGQWTNVSTAPKLGWWSGVIATGAAAGAFGMVFSDDLHMLRPRRPSRDETTTASVVTPADERDNDEEEAPS